MAGASKIIAVDINSGKFDAAIKMGATDTLDSSKLSTSVQSHIAGEMTQWGVDYTTHNLIRTLHDEAWIRVRGGSRRISLCSGDRQG